MAKMIDPSTQNVDPMDEEEGMESADESIDADESVNFWSVKTVCVCVCVCVLGRVDG